MKSELPRIEDGFVVIPIILNGELRDNYEIALIDFETAEHLLFWIQHLCEKVWFTMYQLKHLIELWKEQRNEQ